jgi:hypothetical protein
VCLKFKYYLCCIRRFGVVTAAVRGLASGVHSAPRYIVCYCPLFVVSIHIHIHIHIRPVVMVLFSSLYMAPEIFEDKFDVVDSVVVNCIVFYFLCFAEEAMIHPVMCGAWELWYITYVCTFIFIYLFFLYF